MSKKQHIWKPKITDGDTKVQLKPLNDVNTSFKKHFIPQSYKIECKATTPKDYRIDFLQAIQDNPRVTGDARYDLEDKYGSDVVMVCAFPEESECLVVLDGIGTSNKDFYWTLTVKGQEMLKDYQDRKQNAIDKQLVENSCPICDMLEGK